MRGKKAPKRHLLPDAQYQNIVVAKMINEIMERGKRSTATRIVYDAFTQIADETKKEAVEVFEAAMKNLSPQMEVRSRRVGGANYQIPYPVRAERRQTLALRWLVEAAKKKAGSSMANRLAKEIMDASNKEGAAIKKKYDVHRMAEANRAFAHFAR